MHRNTLKVDLHSHTWHSGDSPMPPRMLVERARAAGIDRIAVTDHGAIEGAFEARAVDPERVIIGEEIQCDDGTEVIGLFLQKLIPMGLPLEEAVKRIRAQGGVVYVPHPFAYLSRVLPRAERLYALADVAEAFNSRAFYPAWNRQALAKCEQAGVASGAGSDSHFPWEVGRAYTELPAFTDASSFLAALPFAKAVGVRPASPFIHAASLGLHAARRLIGRGHGIPLRRSATLRPPLAG